jgi:hypothetical protein
MAAAAPNRVATNCQSATDGTIGETPQATGAMTNRLSAGSGAVTLKEMQIGRRMLDARSVNQFTLTGKRCC